MVPIKSLLPVAKGSGESGNPSSASNASAGGLLGALILIFFFHFICIASTAFAEQAVRIEHDVIFQRVPGLPARVHVTAVGVEVTWMRFIGTFDDTLLVVPLHPVGPGEFEGEVPTPERQLRYSFQFGSSPTDARLSPVFLRKQNCAGQPASGKNAKLIEEAAALEADAEQLSFVQRTLERFAGSGEAK